MKTAIICCENLKEELSSALKANHACCQIIWVSSDYHMNPNRLRQKLQSEIDQLTSIDRILLGYGCCGNAVIGLKATTAEIIIPKADDCIDILLSTGGGKQKRKMKTFFVSKGWLNSAQQMVIEYNRLAQRYGELETRSIWRTMLAQYDYLMFIDTGIEDKKELNNLLQIAEGIASKMDLELIVERGSAQLLYELLNEPYTNDFCVIPKGATISIEDFIEQIE